MVDAYSPQSVTREEDVAAQTAAVVASLNLGSFDFDGRITSVAFIPEADITGDNTNTRTFTLFNRGQDGNGTTEMAALAFITGVNATNDDAIAFTLNATPANRDFNAGDQLTLEETVGASGLANPGGRIVVTGSREYQ